jgi:hypothetical protein
LVITDFNPAINDEANAVAIQADGKVMAAGVAFFGRLNDFGLARYACIRRTSRPMSIPLAPSDLRRRIATY